MCYEIIAIVKVGWSLYYVIFKPSFPYNITFFFSVSGDYDGALTVLTERAYLAQERGTTVQGGKPIGAFCDILANCEINRVLLLMLLQVSF